MGLLLIAAMVMTACTGTGSVQETIEQVAPTLQAAATELAPTVVAAATEIAGGEEATEEPAEEATGDLMIYSTDCETEGYTGLMKEIAAVDPLTVQFSLCAPDPAFLSKVAFSPFAIQPSEYLESTGARRANLRGLPKVSV